MGRLRDTFLTESARYLRDVYLPRLARALAILPAGDLWWRPHPESLSVGTILLHLEGNVRQWILAALGGAPDERDRAAEFAADGSGQEGLEPLLARLRATVLEAARTIEDLDRGALRARHSIQGFDVTGTEVVYHVVEHFSWHVGQVVWIAKARAGRGHGLAFFDDAQVNARPGTTGGHDAEAGAAT